MRFWLLPALLIVSFLPAAQALSGGDQGHGGPSQDKGRLIVKKVVVGSPDTSPSAFSFTVGGATTQFSSTGQNEVLLSAGPYAVTEPEANQDGFATSYSEDCTGVIETRPNGDGQDGKKDDDEHDGTKGDDHHDGTKSDDHHDSTKSDDHHDSKKGDDQHSGTKSDDQHDGTKSDDEHDKTKADDHHDSTKGDDQHDITKGDDEHGGHIRTPVCTITNTFSDEPSTPTPTPQIDVSVMKGATPEATLTDGSATIEYFVTVSNNGPNQANNVTVTDNAPPGVVFGEITGGSGALGVCDFSPTALTCTFPVLGPGATASVSFSATVAAPGTFSNTACAYGDGDADTDLANNCSTATTLVPEPLVLAALTPPVATPPVAKPPVAKAKPQSRCVIVKLSTRTLAAGRFSSLAVKLTKHGRAVPRTRIRFTGPGLFKTVATNRSGIAVTKLRPSTNGIVRVTLLNKKACPAVARIGVLGAFEPPVTG